MCGNPNNGWCLFASRISDKSQYVCLRTGITLFRFSQTEEVRMNDGWHLETRDLIKDFGGLRAINTLNFGIRSWD